MLISTNRIAYFALLATPVLTTLAISPGITYDPINLPKAFVLTTGASLLLVTLVLNGKRLVRIQRSLVISSLLLLISFAISLTTNVAPFSQQFWGVWGRSTGALTYLAFIILMLVAAVFAYQGEALTLRHSFEKLSYFISLYTLAQAGDVDPINWSQKLMVATLGNINFMSSFLGLATISLFSRIIIERCHFSAKLFYLAFSGLNLFLIWISGSIQGIAIFAAGLSILIMIVIRGNSLKLSLAWIFGVTPIGVLILLGTAGIGPLSAMRQETVIFRIDYWLAGIRMTRENWLHGVGIDSYGDYYEQYRDLAAVVRTGPQRVTNTAHNIFLDVSSGAGFIAGLAFLSIFILTIAAIVRMVVAGNLSHTDSAFSAIFIGFLVFSLISINQIGVGVWGFVIMGSILGSESKKRFPSQKLETSSENMKYHPKTVIHGERHSNKQVAMSISLGLISLVFNLHPSITDAKMLRAVEASNFEAMRETVSRITATSFHRNKYQALLVENGRNEEALSFALQEVKIYPRSETSLRIIAFSQSAKKVDRLRASELLKERDPFDFELRDILSEMEQSIP